MSEIVNKVAESGLITLNLEHYLPNEADIVVFDLKPYLFMEMILKEKDFRANLLSTDWTPFENKHVAVICTADAIIPMWAYMLIVNYLNPIAATVTFGTKEEVYEKLLLANINAIDAKEYEEARIVVKGCGDKQAGPSAYLAISAKLQPVVRSLMYGEPCSTVPIYKKKK